MLAGRAGMAGDHGRRDAALRTGFSTGVPHRGSAPGFGQGDP